MPIAWLRMLVIFQPPSFNPTVVLKALLQTSGSFASAYIDYPLLLTFHFTVSPCRYLSDLYLFTSKKKVGASCARFQFFCLSPLSIMSASSIVLSLYHYKVCTSSACFLLLTDFTLRVLWPTKLRSVINSFSCVK